MLQPHKMCTFIQCGNGCGQCHVLVFWRKYKNSLVVNHSRQDFVLVNQTELRNHSTADFNDTIYKTIVTKYYRWHVRSSMNSVVVHVAFARKVSPFIETYTHATSMVDFNYIDFSSVCERLWKTRKCTPIFAKLVSSSRIYWRVLRVYQSGRATMPAFDQSEKATTWHDTCKCPSQNFVNILYGHQIGVWGLVLHVLQFVIKFTVLFVKGQKKINSFGEDSIEINLVSSQ